MSEVASPSQPIPDLQPAPDKLKLTQEIRYPGFETTLREITTSRIDVAAINKIENALDSTQFSEIQSGASLDDTLNWLQGGMTRHLDKINLGSKKRIAVGVEQGQNTPSESIVIATKPVSETGELSSYTYLYKSEDFGKLPENIQQQHNAATKLDLSYVTAAKDQDYNVSEVSDSLMQTALILFEKSAGKELNGEFTPEQLAEAQKNLMIFASSDSSEHEANYHKALEMAGFKDVHRYKEADEDDGGKIKEYIVYNLSVADLMQASKQRRSQASS